MIFLRTLRYHQIHTLLKLQNPLKYLKNPLHSDYTKSHFIFSNSHKSFLPTSIFLRPVSRLAQFEHIIDTEPVNSEIDEERNKKTKKPLDVLFREAVGLSEKLQQSDSESESESEYDKMELKNKLRKLEIEVRSLKENGNVERENLRKTRKREDRVSKDEAKSLYTLFANKAVVQSEKSRIESKRVEEPIVYKELSSDMAFFASYLYKQGYFIKANFLPWNKFDVTCLENNYGRNFLKFVAEKFGKDNQEIAKWLSGSDLKKVAQFGCPSTARKNVFSAKALRTFFKIQEDTVCSKCVFKHSCKFPNKNVWKHSAKNLDLATVMRVITLYALESVPPQLVVPDEIKNSVSRLLKEIVNLSQTVS